MPQQVIVNADDFGLSACENAVILGAFQAGIISSATAMANMPAFVNGVLRCAPQTFPQRLTKRCVCE